MFEVRLCHGAADRLRKALLALSPGSDIVSARLYDGLVVDISPGEVDLTLYKRLPGTYILCALLRIRPLLRNEFVYVQCDAPAAFCIIISDLIQKLIPAAGDDYVTLSFHGRHSLIPKEYIGFRTSKPARSPASSLIEVIDVKSSKWLMPTNDYEYRTIIQIPAEDFKRLIIKLNNFADDGGQVTVSVRATKTEVKFSAANEEVILRTQPGANLDTADCIIEDFQNADEVSFSFSLRHREIIINICELTGIVRLLNTDGQKPVLNCAVGGLGKLMLFFDCL